MCSHDCTQMKAGRRACTNATESEGAAHLVQHIKELALGVINMQLTLQTIGSLCSNGGGHWATTGVCRAECAGGSGSCTACHACC